MMDRKGHGRLGWMTGWLSWLLAMALAAGLCAVLFVRLAPTADFTEVAGYGGALLRAWGLTLALSAVALLLACVLAPLWCVARSAKAGGWRWLAGAGIAIMRGTPLLVLLLFGFYVVADAFGAESRLVVGMVILAVYTSAYLGEMLRGGLESIGAAQWEAARAVGFDDRQGFRHIILPQALRRVLPGLAGMGLNLVKDSSLLSVIGVMEFTKQAQVASTMTYSHFEAYLVLAAGYLLITLPLGWLAAWMEGRLAHAA